MLPSGNATVCVTYPTPPVPWVESDPQYFRPVLIVHTKAGSASHGTVSHEPASEGGASPPTQSGGVAQGLPPVRLFELMNRYPISPSNVKPNAFSEPWTASIVEMLSRACPVTSVAP